MRSTTFCTIVLMKNDVEQKFRLSSGLALVTARKLWRAYFGENYSPIGQPWPY